MIMRNDDAELGLTQPLILPCGGRAYFDFDSGISYRCRNCYAVVGSIGQPPACVEAAEKYRVLEQLGGGKWDYNTGKLKN